MSTAAICTMVSTTLQRARRSTSRSFARYSPEKTRAEMARGALLYTDITVAELEPSISPILKATT